MGALDVSNSDAVAGQDPTNPDVTTTTGVEVVNPIDSRWASVVIPAGNSAEVGTVNDDDTVTLWATTSTTSASTDNGADPNKVVQIVDQLSATTLTGSVANETFRTVAGPTYGTVYRGVAYVPSECDGHGHDRDDRDCGDPGH